MRSYPPALLPPLRRTITQAVAWVLLLGLVACGAPAQRTDQATASTPSTSSSVLPTATAAPSFTVAPTAASVEPRIREGLARTAALERYRMRFVVQNTGRSADGILEQTTLVAFLGDFAGSAVAYGQSVPSNQPSMGQEIIMVDGEVYGRGVPSIPGANPLIWYRLGSTLPPEVSPPLRLPMLLEALTRRVDLAAFAPAGRALIGEQQCDRFRAGLPAALGALDGLGTPTTPGAQAAEATPVVERMEAQGYRFDDAEAVIALCPDGYIHQFTSEVAITPPGDAAQPVTTLLELELSDPNGDITILPPTDPLVPDASGTAPSRAFALQGGVVYAAPDTTSAVVTRLAPTSLLIVLAQNRDGQWYQIRTMEGETGWMPVSAVAFGPDVTPVVPVAP